MKKKFGLFGKIKDKFKKSRRVEEDDHLEYDIADEFDEDDELPDEDFNSQTMTLSKEQRDALDDETQPRVNRSSSVDSTHEMQLPTEEEMDEYERHERLESIRQNASPEDDFDEHSGINDYREFELPISQPKNKKSHLKKWISKKPWKISVAKWRSPKSNFTRESSLSKLEKPPFRWDVFVQNIFHVNKRAKIHTFFLALLICTFAYAAGKITGLMIDSAQKPNIQTSTPILRLPEKLDSGQLQAITSVDLFNATPKVDEGLKEPIKQPPKVDRNLICLSAQRSSSLPIELMNTVVLQDSVKSVASVQVRGQKEAVDIREGQKIANFAEVGRIDRQKLIFKNLNSGECEFIENAEKEGKAPKSFNLVSKEEGKEIMDSQANTAIKNEGNNFSIKKSLRDEMLNNISEVLTQARAVQIQNPDGSYSFKMTEIVPGSIYSKLNIKDGDVIEQIDGEKIQDLNAVMTKFGRIREIDNLSLTIKRNGSSQTYDYSFE
jgi:type II secretory pathway component PulC